MSQLPRSNWCDNPSFEKDTVGWSATPLRGSAGTSITRVWDTTLGAGSWAGEAVVPATQFAGVGVTLVGPFLAGVVYTVSCTLKLISGGRALVLGIAANDNVSDYIETVIDISRDAARYTFRWVPAKDRALAGFYLLARYAEAATFRIDGVRVNPETGGYAAAVLATGPIGYWRMGLPDTMVDSTGRGSEGTYHATPLTIVPGALVGGDPEPWAKGFNGINQFVSIPNTPTLDVGDVFTIMAWVSPGATGAVRSIFCLGGTSAYLRLDSTNNLNLLKSGITDIVHSTQVVGSGWHQVVATKTGSSVHLYIDAVDRTGTVTNATCLNQSIYERCVGAQHYSGGYDEASNASIDELALWNRVLTLAEITALYTGASTVPSWVDLPYIEDLDATIVGHLAAVHTPIFQLFVQWDGANWEDETDYVLKAVGIESIDGKSGTLEPSEVNIELDNSTLRYSPDNPLSPIFASLTHAGQRARLRMGYNDVVLDVLTGWIAEISPRESDLVASMRLLDRAGLLAEAIVSYSPNVNVQLSSVVREMLTGLNLVEGTDFLIDPSSGWAQFATAVKANLLAELQEIAIAEGGRVYIDVQGRICFMNRTNHLAALETPIVTFRRGDVAYDISQGRKREGRATRLNMAYEDRLSAVSDELVYEQKSPILISEAYTYMKPVGKEPDTTYAEVVVPSVTTWGPGVVLYPDPNDPTYGTPNAQQLSYITDVPTYVPGYTIPGGTSVGAAIYEPAIAWGRMSLSVKGQDMTRWESEVPLDFGSIDTITANTEIDGGGTAITLVPVSSPPTEMSGLVFGTDVYYQWEPEGPTGSLQFWNSRNATVYITVLKILGKPARTGSPWSVVAFDQEAADIFGIIEETISNAYLPTSDQAQLRAQELLFFKSGTRARIDFVGIDGVPYLHPRDSFAFVDDSVVPEVPIYLQVIQNDWSYSIDGGYSSSLGTAPSLPSTSGLQNQSIPKLSLGALQTATDAGPWKWGADAHPLIWSYSDWA